MIVYLDLIAGNNANDGLTPATPKLSLTNATALITGVTDEIRVRATDALFSSVGNATWTNESNNVIMTGDTTGSIAAGDYIFKTVSGSTIPKPFLVASRTYAAGTNLTTIVLTNTTNCYYYGTTETVPTSKLVITAVIPLQTFGRNGQTSGTAASWNRVDTKISGGWDSGYTSQNGYTLIRNTANTSAYSVLNNEATARQYWDIQRFVIFNSNQYSIQYNTYCHWKDCVWIGVLNGTAARQPFAPASTWSIYENCFFYFGASAYESVNGAQSNAKMINCHWQQTQARQNVYNFTTSGLWSGCTIIAGNASTLHTVSAVNFYDCYIRSRSTTNLCTTTSANNFYNCTINCVATPVTLGTATTNLYGCTYTNTTGLFTCTGVAITGTSFTSTTGGYTLTYPALNCATNTFTTTSGALIVTSTTSLSNLTYSNTTGAITINSPSIIGCNITNTTGAWTFNNTTQTIASGSTFIHTTGTVAFTSPIVSGIDLSGTTYTLTHNSATVVEKFYGNTIKASTSVTFNNENTPVLQQQPIVSGNTWTNGLLNTAKGLFVDNAGLDLATSAQLYPQTIIYDTDDSIDKTKWGGFKDAATVPQVYQPYYSIPVISPSGNSILYDGGFIDLTTDVYTGKTSYSGTSALRLYNTLASATDSVFRTVDFNVEENATGHTSFWVKASQNNVGVEFNIMNDGSFIWNDWKGFTVNNSYINIRVNLTGSTFTTNGTATLYFRIVGELSGVYINIDNVGFYSTATTENLPSFTKSYIYAGGLTTNTIRKYFSNNLNYLNLESPSYGGQICSLATDGTYIYAGGYTTQTIRKYNLSDLTLVTESPNYGGSIFKVMVSGSYIYAGGYTTNVIRKYNISDLSYVTQVGFGYYVNNLATDGTYIYACGGGSGSDYKIRKYNLSDLTLVTESPNYGGEMLGLVIYGNYIYAGGAGDYKIRKYNLSDLTLVTTSAASYGGQIYALATDGTYMYVGGLSNAVYKYNLSDLSYVGAYPSYGSFILAIEVDGTYVYAGGGGNTIRKYNSADLTYVGESTSYGASIYSLLVNNT